MATPQNDFDGAQIILKKYYSALIQQMAEEIFEHREDFESPGINNQAGEIIENMRCSFIIYVRCFPI